MYCKDCVGLNADDPDHVMTFDLLMTSELTVKTDSFRNEFTVLKETKSYHVCQ